MPVDPLDAVALLARRARAENPPLTDVRLAPLLRQFRAEPMPLFPLAWTAAASALAACVVLVMVLHSAKAKTVAQTDSITPLFSAAQVQLP